MARERALVLVPASRAPGTFHAGLAPFPELGGARLGDGREAQAHRDDERVVTEAERIYAELRESGVEVVLDDRESAAGVKFNDADLIGFPVQVVVGKRGIEAGQLDIKVRATGDKRQVPSDGVVAGAVSALESAP